MNIEYIKEKLDLIRASGDDTTQHIAQDDLLKEVLQAISEGHGDPQALAREVLMVFEIEFSRWYE